MDGKRPEAEVGTQEKPRRGGVFCVLQLIGSDPFFEYDSETEAAAEIGYCSFHSAQFAIDPWVRLQLPRWVEPVQITRSIFGDLEQRPTRL